MSIRKDSKWLPIINKQGICYFYDKSTGNCQWTYPKEYDKKKKKYINIAFCDWEKVIISPKVFWKNKTTNITQDVKPSSTTYIHEAAFMDNLAFVQFYIEYNGDLDVTDSQGRNALHYSIMNDNYSMTQFLLKFKINPEQRDLKGQCPIFYCIQYRAYYSLKLLIDNGTNLNCRDNQGNTVLHNAIRTKNLKVIFYLIRSGAKLTVKNNQDQYPIDLAVEDENWMLVKYLTKMSNIFLIKTQIQNEDKSLLEMEFKNSHVEKKSKKKKTIQESSTSNTESKNKKIHTTLKKKGDAPNSSSLSIDSINFDLQEVPRNPKLALRKKFEEEDRCDPTSENVFDDVINNKSNVMYTPIDTNEMVSRKNKKKWKGNVDNISTSNHLWNEIKSRIYSGAVTSGQFLKKSFCKVLEYGKEKSVTMKKNITEILNQVSFYMENSPDIENQVDYFIDEFAIEKNYLQLLNNEDRQEKAEEKETEQTNPRQLPLRYISLEEIQLEENLRISTQLIKNKTKNGYKKNYMQMRTKRINSKFYPHYRLPFLKLFTFTGHHFSQKKLRNILNEMSFDKTFSKTLLNQKFIQMQLYRRKLKGKGVGLSGKPSQIDGLTYSKDIIEYKIENIHQENEMRNPGNSLNIQPLQKQISSDCLCHHRYDRVNKDAETKNYYESILKTISNINSILDHTSMIEPSHSTFSSVSNDDIPHKQEQQTNEQTMSKLTKIIEGEEKWDQLNLDTIILNHEERTKEESPLVNVEEEGGEEEEEEEDDEGEGGSIANILAQYNEQLQKLKESQEDVSKDSQISNLKSNN